MKLTKEHLVDAISQTKQYHNEHESGGPLSYLHYVTYSVNLLQKVKLLGSAKRIRSGITVRQMSE